MNAGQPGHVGEEVFRSFAVSGWQNLSPPTHRRGGLICSGIAGLAAGAALLYAACWCCCWCWCCLLGVVGLGVVRLDCRITDLTTAPLRLAHPTDLCHTQTHTPLSTSSPPSAGSFGTFPAGTGASYLHDIGPAEKRCTARYAGAHVSEYVPGLTMS